jgi:hypothetical protein
MMTLRICACVLALWMAASVSAAPILDYNETQSSPPRGDGPFTIGTLFQVGASPINITHLGAQDVNGATGFGGNNGFVTSPISVGLWTGDGLTLLGSASVSSNDLLIDSWRYAPITQGPLTLQPNTNYLLGAFVGSGREWFIDDVNAPPAFTAGAGITILQNRFRSGSFGAPLNDGTLLLGRWGAANATDLSVPEPASIGLWSLLAIGLVGHRLRRKK